MDMLPAAQSSMAIHMGTGRRQDLSCGNSLSSIGCLRAPPALILDIEQACGCCNQQAPPAAYSFVPAPPVDGSTGVV